MMSHYIRYPYMGSYLIDWNPQEICGYKPISTYYTDFGIAERFGDGAIRDTYKRAVQNWGESIKLMTEIVMVLNWKMWEHNMRKNDEMVELYRELWRDAEDRVFKNFKGEDLSYFYRTTD